MFIIKSYLLFSFIGFLFENFLFILIKKPYNSSVLYGPWTSVYGIAFFLIIGIGKLVKKLKLKKWQEVFVFFIIATIILTLLENLTGHLILWISHIRYWSYENMKFKIGEFICLEASLFWGILALLTNYVIYPRIKKVLRKFPNSISIILFILYIIDVIYNIIF